MRPRAKVCCLLLLALALAACKPGANRGATNEELCRKYEACGCQSYEDCMRGAAESPGLDKPGTRECMLRSSCESLCFNVPDGCINDGGGAQPGADRGGQQRSNCSAIRCGKNSDCPSDCYGGCDGVICYSF